MVAVLTGARAAAGSRLLTVGSLFDIIERSWKSLADVLAQLKGAGLVAAEVVYTATDPPIKLFRRVIPPLRVGAVAA